MNTPEQNIFACVMSINCLGQGWEEVYWLKTSDYTSSIGVGKQLCKLRSSWFGGGDTVLEFARAIKLGHARDAVAVQMPFPWCVHPNVGTETTVDKPEDPYTGPLYRFQTATGKWINRIWRGCRDSWFHGKAWSIEPITPLDPGVTIPTGEGSASAINLQRGFLSALLTLTSHLHLDANKVGTLSDWTSCGPRKIGARKTGRPFGMSAGRAPAHSTD